MRQRQIAYLLALREDRQPFAQMVEVLELNLLQRSLPESVVEQEAQGDAVPELGLAGEDR